MRNTAFRFNIDMRHFGDEVELWRHAGAARFGRNQGLRFVLDAMNAKKNDASVKIPWSRNELINSFNTWKKTSAAGCSEDGSVGLPWRDQVCAAVFEESLADLEQGFKRYWKSRKERKGIRVGFPDFEHKNTSAPSFRLRNRNNSVRLGSDHIVLPWFGAVKVRGRTRRLRRMLRLNKEGVARATILFATVKHDGVRWYISLNVEADEFHPAMRTKAEPAGEIVGIDVGLKTFAVAATQDATEVWRSHAPKPLRAAERRLRKKCRALTRKKKGSKNRSKARRVLKKEHRRVRCQRENYVQNLSGEVAKTHGHVALEDLHISGMMQNHNLARSIADAGWGMFGRQVEYKSGWYGCKVTWVDRFFASTKECSRCHKKVAEMPLSERVFECSYCGFRVCRDLNGAANCAYWAVTHPQENVAVQHTETLNGCGEESSGCVPGAPSETGLCEAAKPRRRRSRGKTSEKDGVGAESSVNTL